MMKKFLLGVIFLINLYSCLNNNPYPQKESHKNILYTSFAEEPKHLDPAKAYSSNQIQQILQVYEPLFQYHYLKRPVTLVPLTATEIPQAKKIGKHYRYRIKIKKGIYYAKHAAFAKDNKGNFIWHLKRNQRLPDVENPINIKPQATRELVVDDYIYQIKRLANPMLNSPIYSTIKNYIMGMATLGKKLSLKLREIRKIRKKLGGVFYNRQIDEKIHPIYLDMRKFDIRGLKKIDDYTFDLTLSRKYPQIMYWLSMSFFVPVPWEVDRFFSQAAAKKKNFTLDRFPVGTGPFILKVNQPNFKMIYEKNPKFNHEVYPIEGSKLDIKSGLLKDAGKKIPFIDKIIYSFEKEAIPRWVKFLQGYYDSSAIASDVFDSAITITSEGTALTDVLRQQNIHLKMAVDLGIRYYAFNMEDDIVGGYSKKKKMLRQAIAIAINTQEFIQIFSNGRGKPAHSPIPPGIFGYNAKMYNQQVYEKKAKKIVRKPISIAKKLLAYAGFPNGVDPKTGRRLKLTFDTFRTDSGAKAYFDWLRKQFIQLNIDLVIRKTNYNQFQEKTNNGNYQMLFWGWGADYPDAENFLFLFYGPNGKRKYKGENVANYANPKFDKLFKQLENMENTNLRKTIIEKAIHILQQDSPWIFDYHPVGYALFHDWYRNLKIHPIANNTLKYKKIDLNQRTAMRKKWNMPTFWPLWLFVVFIFAITTLAIYKKMMQDRSHTHRKKKND